MDHLAPFIVNHWPLWVALVILLFVIFLNELMAQKKRGKELSTTAAVDMINNANAVVIDLRGQDLFSKGHIIDAICASEDDFSQQRMDKHKSKPIILVCARGIQASSLAMKLRTQGFTQPMVLAGGMGAWLAANLPVIKGRK